MLAPAAKGESPRRQRPHAGAAPGSGNPHAQGADRWRGSLSQQAAQKGPRVGRSSATWHEGQAEGKTTASRGSTRADPPASSRSQAPAAALTSGPPPSATSSQEALLLLLLAGEATLRPGHRLQALPVHLVLAHDAHAVVLAPHPHQRLLHELQHVALVVREAEEELLGVRVGGLVRDVLCALLVRLLPVGLVLVVGDQDLLLLLDE